MTTCHGNGGWGAGPSRGVCGCLLARCVLALVLMLHAGGITLAGTISLGWNPLLDPTVTGYRVYYGLDPAAMTSDLDWVPSRRRSSTG